MLDAAGQDEISVCPEKKFGGVVGVVRHIRVAEHVGEGVGHHSQGIPADMHRQGFVFQLQRIGDAADAVSTRLGTGAL